MPETDKEIRKTEEASVEENVTETEETAAAKEAEPMDAAEKESQPADAAAEETQQAGTSEEEDCAADAAESESAKETSEETEESKGTEEPEEETPEDTEAENMSGSKERKFFGRKKEKKDKKDEKIEELTDKLTRQMAEFDNYRKRTEKEKAANYMIGAKDVVEKLLPVVDNFERGLADADLSDPFQEGMSKIYKQLMTMLTDLGVTPIEAVGKEFDPNLHNAVMHIEDENFGENVVAEEFQKGYLFKDQVVRHSMVKVAN